MKKPEKYFMDLQPSEKAVFRAAADIFAGYAASGKVNEKNERDLMKKSVSQAILMAELVEEMIISDDEIDPDEGKHIG